MKDRTGTLTTTAPTYPTVDTMELGGATVEVGHLVRFAEGRRRPCLCRVIEIRLEGEDGPVREVTLAVATTLSGGPHPQAGKTRVVLPNALTPVRQKAGQ